MLRCQHEMIGSLCQFLLHNIHKVGECRIHEVTPVRENSVIWTNGEEFGVKYKMSTGTDVPVCFPQNLKPRRVNQITIS